MHHIAVDDHVILALQAQFTGITRAGFALERNVIAIGDRLGTDEALFEIGVDDTGRLRRARTLRNGPGARLLRPDGEIGDEAEQGVARADDAVEARLGEADR